MTDYRFEPEGLEFYDGNGQYIGRVDIRILLKNDFEKDDAYYIIECKWITGTCDLNRKYIKEGVARFVTQKYSSYYGRNIMLGFVQGEFEPVDKSGMTESYRCRFHLQSGEVDLRHIFADYLGIVQ